MIGRTISRYTIESRLGQGGMGTVYLAHDTQLDRRVAIKVISTDAAPDRDLAERLLREAQAASRLNHPNIVTVYEIGQADGIDFIAMEHVDGQPLSQLIPPGGLPIAQVLDYAQQIVAAVAVAHEAGVIHRDLKPENVLIKSDGSVKVVDFGIAHVEGPDVSRLTRTGFALGTPAYMAPEQLLGGTIDPRADVYAWGVVLSEMLQGHHPLDRATAATPATSIARAWTTIINRCLQADPAARPNARELIDALGSDPLSLPLSRGLTPPRWWWEFHQGIAALIYWLMVIPAWYARGRIGGTVGRAFFITLLASVIVAANLRLHLWFTSRFYESELTAVHDRSSRWIRIADWVFAATLILGGLLISDERSPLTILLPSVAVGAVVAFLLIEPVTARAAFGRER